MNMALTSVTEMSFSSTPGSSASTTTELMFSRTSRSGTAKSPLRRNSAGHRGQPCSKRSNMRSISSRMALKMSCGALTDFSEDLVISVLAMVDTFLD